MHEEINITSSYLLQSLSKSTRENKSSPTQVLPSGDCLYPDLHLISHRYEPMTLTHSSSPWQPLDAVKHSLISETEGCKQFNPSLLGVTH